MLIHYLKIVFRNLRKYGTQNIVGIVGLAVGLVIFSISCYSIEWGMNVDTEYPGAGRMYILRSELRGNLNGNIYGLPEIFPEVEKITLMGKVSYEVVNVELDKKITGYEMIVGEVDTAFFGFFDFRVLSGNRHAMTNTVNSIVLFESEAKRFDENIHALTGKTIEIKDEKYQITGVLKNPEHTQYFRMSALIVNKTGGIFGERIYTKYDPTIVEHVFIKLKSRRNIKAFEEKLAAYRFPFEIVQERAPMTMAEDGTWARVSYADKTDNFKISPLSNPFERKETIYFYLNSFAIGLIILLVVLFNYISFHTAAFYNRFKECAVRKTNGAGKMDVFMMFSIEILAGLVIACCLGLLLIESFYDPVREIFHFDLKKEMLMEGMLKYFLYIVVFTLLLCLIPINIINKMSIYAILFGALRRRTNHAGRNILLFAQMVVLMLFLSAATILSLQTRHMRSQLMPQLSEEMKENIFRLTIYPAISDRDVLVQNIASSPLIEKMVRLESEVSQGVGLMLDMDIGIKGYENVSIYYGQVPSAFFGFFECELIEGDIFNDDSPRNDIVINESFAKLYRNIGENPVGKTFSGYRVVGVIKDLGTVQNTEPKFPNIVDQATFYIRYAKTSDFFRLYIKPVKGQTAAAFQHAKSCIKPFAPSNNIVQFTSLNEEIDFVFRDEKRQIKISTIALGLSLIIGMTSIYSAIMMNVKRRRKEVAIRKINGATLKDIAWLFSKTYIVLWTVACLLASPFVYYYGHRWLSKYVFRISLDITLFAGIYLLILTLIVATIIFQILKVAKLNPAEEL